MKIHVWFQSTGFSFFYILINEKSFLKASKDRFTIDPEVFTCESNGGKVYDAEESTKVGSYNWLLDSCPKDLYDNSKESLDGPFQSASIGSYYTTHMIWLISGHMSLDGSIQTLKSTICKSRRLFSTTRFRMDLHGRFWKFFLLHQKLDFRGIIGAHSQAWGHFRLIPRES